MHLSVVTAFLFFHFCHLIDTQENPQGKRLVCYYASWASHRKPQFYPVDIDTSLCTHIVYAYAGLKNDTADSIVSISPFTDLKDNYGLGHYIETTSLKLKNPHLKVLLSVGGWTEGSINYSLLAEDPTRRRHFVNSVINYLRTYNFDGLDINWQFPGERGGSREDKNNYPYLLRNLKEEFIKHNYILTVFLSSHRIHVDNGYDLPAIAQTVDWINLHCFSFSTPWDKKFGISAPLNSNSEYNVKTSVEYYLTHGVPSNKLVLVVSTHGYGYTLVSKPGRSDGIIGLYTDDKGFLAFHEICKYLADAGSGWKEIWDDQSSTPIAINGDNKISYDNPRSIRLKVKYAVQKNLSGVGVWSLDVDDYDGDCLLSEDKNKEKSKFPNVKAIYEELQPVFQTITLEKVTDHIEVFVAVYNFE
ncbi:putative chitinase 2 [Lycorma delicatula]|uniref:putative chitinase 2 n=1 Tax=Lycorma delicatula TaxID=130591 RepID=UPI003F5161F5